MKCFFVALFTTLFSTAVLAEPVVAKRYVSNAERFKDRLPPLAPRHLFDASKSRQAARTETSPTPCTNIFTNPVPIRVESQSGSTIGYLGYSQLSDVRYYNTIYSNGYYPNGDGFLITPKKGSSDNYAFLLSSPNVYTSHFDGKSYFCASGMQSGTYDLTKYGRNLSPQQNYAVGYECTTEGTLTQLYDYKWDRNGLITMSWLQPTSAAYYGVWTTVPYMYNNRLEWYISPPALSANSVPAGRVRVNLRLETPLPICDAASVTTSPPV
ncbi:hypothetical protein CYLTODRAFT_487593 [Cylindrobasidium torrendii FP15055 ss-10]|uniref:Uncharacterized protein n=1 Tax=Cylindrobasidium torrendii FP15055 ss-10 TaxID=1314674 RepID=A0A0D7BKE7_9AGAR|nr:hypothetical protein CYLTODRAFT_487593 [Cylindrobasidium torrendii FP15055 ss-10]